MFSERFLREDQPLNERLDIVRPLYSVKPPQGPHLIGSAFQVITLRDKLNESLAEAIRLASMG